MTSLRIDMKRYKTACREAREGIAVTFELGNWTAAEFRAQPFSEKKDWFEFSRGQFLRWDAQVPAAPRNADELRDELRVAARSAMQFGASEAQIATIVALAEAEGDFNILSGGRLTRADASSIIRDFYR